MRGSHRARLMFGVGALLVATGAGSERRSDRTPVVTTRQFAFYSDFDTNLNDALIAAGVARKGGQPELFRAGDEAACFGKLPASARAAWEGAVAYYKEVIAPANWSDREQFLLRVQLAGFDEIWQEADSRQFVEIARSFRAAAAPAYRACRWVAQNERNRRWIEELKARLAMDERRITSRLEDLYRKRWNGLPIPVDVVQTAGWSGANSILRDLGGGHLLISNENRGPAALEVAFHEASHLLMNRDAPLRQALDKAASAAEVRLPEDLWHVVLFYTTGETVRHILDDGGPPRYTPMLYEIFDRGDWAGYRNALESAWRPYVQGDRTLSEAAAGLLAEIKKSQP